MRSFPALVRAKRLFLHPVRDTNSADREPKMPGNTDVDTGNISWLGTPVGAQVPNLVVINPPQDGITQAFALVTVTVWLVATWRTSRATARL